PVLDAAVNVTTFAEHARRNGEAFSFLMSKSKPKKEYLLFNRIDLSGETMGKLPSLLDTVEQIGQPLLGVVPEDEAAVRRHTKEYGKSDYHKAVSHIAGRLTGKNVPLCSGFRREGFRRRLFLDK
ncbi:MAG: hypothetical protein MJ078_06170, partial [Clostridia bacterium]|nr:hypothetical protein [Clostridia bacterium]